MATSSSPGYEEVLDFTLRKFPAIAQNPCDGDEKHREENVLNV